MSALGAGELRWITVDPTVTDDVATAQIAQALLDGAAVRFVGGDARGKALLARCVEARRSSLERLVTA